jgi:tRNA(adenine34) deaminase
MTSANPGRSATDTDWMRRAIALGLDAAAAGEVPVGALLVREGAVLGEGWNRPIGTHDPTAHAEVVALRAAGATAGDYRLAGSTLYVTLEPCIMCSAALIHARVERVVFGAWDPKAGGAGSVLDVFRAPRLNHRVDVFGGVLAEECAQLLQRFFAERRR